MKIFPETSSDGQCLLMYDQTNFAVPVFFRTTNQDDALLFPKICRDSKFLQWATSYSPDSTRLQLVTLFFEKIELSHEKDAYSRGKFSRLQFLIQFKDRQERNEESKNKVQEAQVILEDLTVALLLVFRLNPPITGEATKYSTVVRSREFVLFLKKPQAVLGTDTCLQIPQGNFDETGAFVGVDAQILTCFAGLDTIRFNQLTDMTAQSQRRQTSITSDRNIGIAPSPHNLGYRLRLYLYRETVSQSEVTRLQALSNQNYGPYGIELCSLNEAWKSTTDAVSLSSLFLFHELRYHNKMPKYKPPREPKKLPVFTSVGDLDPNGQGYNLRVRVADAVPKTPLIVNKTNGLNLQRNDIIVGDASGCVRFRLTQEQLTEFASVLTNGSTLILRNVDLDMAGGHIAIIVHHFSKIDVPTDDELSKFDFQVNLSNDVSAPEYEEKVILPAPLSQSTEQRINRGRMRGRVRSSANKGRL